MTYPEIVQYLESFIDYEKIPAWSYKQSIKLERINDFLNTIGNPHDALKCVHVAGTKGKGSTCAFIAFILRQAGYRVGLYTSPHLSDFRERIRILNPVCDKRHAIGDFEGMISKRELADLVIRLKPVIEQHNKRSQYGPLSFFEFYTALAFMYFKTKKVDFAVLETGLGGRLDATNVVSPLVCAITPISYEHTDKLGSTLREIAAEKAGIIKGHQVTRSPGHQLVVISAPQESEAQGVFRDRCRKAGAQLYEVGRDIHFKAQSSKLKAQSSRFIFRGFGRKYDNLRIRLLGRHQLVNATVAVGAIEALRFHNIDIGIDPIRKGLYNTLWPGRCEVIARNPMVVLDGAQNIASARVLKEAIKERFFAAGAKFKKLVLILGVSKDKDIKGIYQELCHVADEIILTQADNPRAAGVDDIEKDIRSLGQRVNRSPAKTKNVKEAITLARRITNKEDLILVTGSLFVVGEAREIFKARPKVKVRFK